MHNLPYHPLYFCSWEEQVFDNLSFAVLIFALTTHFILQAVYRQAQCQEISSASHFYLTLFCFDPHISIFN